MRLVQLNVHPLKSGAIRPVRSIDVQHSGLRGDRTWMVVDADGRLVSAREVHRLFHVVADTPDTDPTVRCALRLRAPGLPDLHLDEPTGDPEP
ncbi:MAG TPA: MOSC N-terminal beta barrel domain-containing protein, partial [Nocardioides sp.]